MKITPIADESCSERESGTCYFIDSWIPGPTIWLSSGVHGDEVGPQRSIKTLLHELQDETITLSKWKLIIIPEANPFAVKQNVRSIDNRNLNRIFADDIIENSSAEHIRAAFLKELIQKTRPDIILDLHSMSGETSVPFLYSPLKEVKIAAELGIAFVVAGWSKLSELAARMGVRAMWVGLADYGNQQGIPSFTLEAGTHDSPSSEIHATRFIKNILSYYKMYNNSSFELIGWTDTVTVIEMTEAHFCSPLSNPKETFVYKIDPTNFSKIQKWTLIAYDDNTPVIAEYNAILVQPTTPEAMVAWNEAFFLGKIIEERKII